jgi:hypothetical protein
MKGKIAKEGKLVIVRGGKEVGQYCCNTATREVACCDWCPQFGEPEMAVRKVVEKGQVIDSKICPDETMLTICQNRTLYFDEFIDERG